MAGANACGGSLQNKKGRPISDIPLSRDSLGKKKQSGNVTSISIDENPFAHERGPNDRLRIGFRHVELGDRRRPRRDGRALAPLEGGSTLIPSAVFFDYEAKGRVLFGSEAIAAYVGQTEGRLMRALKSILGSP